MSYVFYDTETTGLDPRFDQIIQFAAIKTDENFNEVDRIDLRCRVQPHIIPSATALAINRTSLAQCFDRSLPSHYDMMAGLKEKLESWSPAIFCGWNSIPFDEEFLRHGFYQSLQPAYLTSFFGNARLDILKIAQAAYIFEPQSIKVPAKHNGNETFSLDPLSRANGHTPTQAHDALSDVQATIYMARTLRHNAPQVWSQAVRFARKISVIEFFGAGENCILTESYKGKSYQYPVVQIGVDPTYDAFLVVADLTRDFSRFNGLSDEEKLLWLSTSPQPLRKVKANASPMLMPIDELDNFAGINLDGLIDISEMLTTDQELCSNLTRSFLEMNNREFVNIFVEQQLYDDFPDKMTERCWAEFHNAPWDSRWPILQRMPDIRYRKLGMRLIHEHSPTSLPAETQKKMKDFIRSKVTGEGILDPPWRTINSSKDELEKAKLEARFAGQSNLFQSYSNYIDQL